MGLLTIRQNDFLAICNKMDGVENVDPKVFLRTFLMRSKLPLINGLIERSVGFCPEKWFPEIRDEVKRLAETDIERFESVALLDELYYILDENLYSSFYNLQSSKEAEIYSRTNQGLFTNDDDLESEYALHWVYMAITRPIDTLYIKLNNSSNEFSQEIVEIGKGCGADILSDPVDENLINDELPF